MTAARAPLVRATDLRIDLAAGPALDRASFEVRGESAVLMGDGAHALLAAIANAAEIRGGSLALAGADVARREHRPVTGLAPLDPPLFEPWTAREYLVWGGRLAAMSPAAARALADRTLERLGLAKLAPTPIGRLPLAERRALVLAQAVLTEPEVLVAAGPLSGLEPDAARFLFEVYARACEGRRWLTSVFDSGPASPERPLAASADEVLVLAAGGLVRRGALRALEEAGGGYEIKVLGPIEPLAALLAARGIGLHGGPGRYFVDLLPPATTSDLLACSLEANTPIVELIARIEPPLGSISAASAPPASG